MSSGSAGISLTVPCYGVGPLWTGACSCDCRRVYNYIHNGFVHIDKCTASQFQDTGTCPLAPTSSMSPGRKPSPWRWRSLWNTKESPTRYNQSRSPFLWISFLFLYKHVFNRFTHEKVQGCDQSTETPHHLQNTACLSKNGNLWNQSLSQWPQWLLIYTSCRIN